MTKAKPLVFLSICAFLLLYTNAFPYSEKDYPQRIVSLEPDITEGLYSKEDYPQRIVSLGPDITEELYILGAESRLVGCTVYCQRPPEAKMKEKVGTIIEISLEKVLSLHPDLVLAISLTPPVVKGKLTSLGIKTITFPSPKSFSEICERFLKLGRIIGKEREAEEIMLLAAEKISSVKERVEGLQRPRVFVQIGSKPLVTINKDSFINDFIEYAGGINITKDIKNTHYSRERVLKDDPDVIVIATMGINGEKEKKVWQKFKTLKAVRDDRISFIDSKLICSPTLLSFIKTLREISKILHPEDE